MNEIFEDAGRIDDTTLAEHMAYAEKPYREIQSDAERLGLLDASIALSGLANNAADKAQQEYLGVKLADSTGVLQEAASGEAESRQEYLSKIAAESSVFANGWFTGDEIPDANQEAIRNGFHSLWSQPEVSFLKDAHHKIMLNSSDWMELDSAGIRYCVTVTNTSRRMGDFKRDSSKSNEPMSAIRLETGNSGMRGGPLFVALHLPTSMVDEFLPRAIEDPRLFLELVDIAMTQEIGARESWVDARPRNAQGFVQRMRLRRNGRHDETLSFTSEEHMIRSV